MCRWEGFLPVLTTRAVTTAGRTAKTAAEERTQHGGWLSLRGCPFRGYQVTRRQQKFMGMENARAKTRR